VINHIDQYPSMVFVITAVKRATEMRRRSSVALMDHGKHMFFGRLMLN
jgi:hypothetical protein